MNDSITLQQRKLYFSKDPEGVQLFTRGGGPTFSRGGGIQMLISIETHITCDFPGGGPASGPPLWIRTLDRQVVKGTGSERYVGYF